MDTLIELTSALSKEEHKEFLRFISRNQKRTPEKIAQLFHYLASSDKKKREEILSVLYPNDQNVIAYHATRKRLIKELSSFIVHIHKQKDISAEGQIEELFHVSKYLFLQNLEEVAWDFLKQAEKLAIQNEAYLLLNNIYSFQIEKSSSEYATELRQLLIKKESAMKMASDQDNATIAYQIVRHKLTKALESGEELNINKEVTSVLKKLEITESINAQPRILYNLISIIRTASLIRKDFYSLEPFLKQYYQTIEEKKSFNKFNHSIKIQLLYILAHSLYRNKKFNEATIFLEKMEAALFEFKSAHYKQFYPKYCLLKAAVLNYSKKNNDAIKLLKSFIEDSSVNADRISLFNGYLNLSTYYFQNGQYQSSIKVFQNLQHSDKWLAEIMGREWLLKKHLVECINQFEIGNSDLVALRIKFIRKNFQDLFGRELYQRILVFISIMEKLNKNPLIATTQDFKNEVEKSFLFIEAEKEDLQAITFYAWLKGRMTSQNYYSVLMGLVK